MPTVKRWADDLRAVFGAADIQAAMRDLGYYASEAGRTIDTRKPLGSVEVVATPAPGVVVVTTGAARGR